MGEVAGLDRYAIFLIISSIEIDNIQVYKLICEEEKNDDNEF